MSLSDPSKVGGERVSKTSFIRPEVGLYLRFLRDPLFGGWADMMVGEMIPSSVLECGWSRVVVGNRPNTVARQLGPVAGAW